MFKSKKLKELEEELYIKNRELKKLADLIKERDRENHKLLDQIQEITTLKDKKPEDCIPGSYCKACEFAKEYIYRRGLYENVFHVCNKGGSCSEFVQKQ